MIVPMPKLRVLACLAVITSCTNETPSGGEPPRARGMMMPLKQAPAEFSGFFAPGGAPLPIYLNGVGGTFTAGADNSSTNRSSVVQSGSRTLRAYAGTAAQWDEIVACVADEFARFNVTVTDVEPTGGVEYVEAVIGDQPSSVNLPNGVGGVAPIDTFTCNIIPRAIVYTFAEVVGNDPQVVCEITAQEVAHAFSLDHEYLASDPMTYLNYSGHKTFQDQDASCGEYQPRECSCGGATQNSVQVMLDKLGPSGGAPVEPVDDPVPPTVSITSPADGASLPADSTIQVVATIADDVNVAAAELVWSYTGSVFACPGTYNNGAVTCTRSGSTHTWSIRVGQGTRTFQVRARDAGGNTVTSAARTITLATDGTTPPVDDTDAVAPVVNVVAPANGASMAGNGPITITATATDDQQLGSVELLWTYANAAFGCPLSQQNVSCVVDGDVYAWTLNVATGTRAFQVRAIDVAGNMATTPERTVSLTSGDDDLVPTPGDDALEDNDAFEQAKPLSCGTAQDLVAIGGDVDWFAVAVEPGVVVSATLTSDADAPVALSLHGAAGSSSALAAVDDAVASGAVAATADGASIAVQIATPAGSATADYRVSITCEGGGGEEPIDPPTTEPTDDESEPNDDVTSASEVFCRQESSYVAADDDWFFVRVRDGDALEAHVDATGAVVLELYDDDGAAIPGAALTGGKGVATAANLPAGIVHVRVSPSTDAVAYTLRTECVEGELNPPPPTAAMCAGAGTPKTSAAPAAVAALAGWIALRRRRRA